MELSVIIPSYNARGTICSSVLSAVASGAAEVVVVDDGSSDGTASLLESLPCRYIRQENSGVSAARKRGFAESTGRFVIFLDADDLLRRGGVQTALRVLEADKSIGVVVGGLTYRSRSGKLWPRRQPMPEITSEILIKSGYSPCPPGGIVYRSEVVKDLIEEQLVWVEPTYAEDFEWIVRASLVSKIAVSHVETIQYNPVGGRSLRDKPSDGAELVRSVYGQALGITFKPLGFRNAVKDRLLRKAMSRWGEGRAIEAWVLRIGAVLVCPSSVLSKISLVAILSRQRENE
jgi:glycosyltransferase involved in cell wall biosynthesis